MYYVYSVAMCIQFFKITHYATLKDSIFNQFKHF